MLQTLRAIIDKKGKIRLLEKVELKKEHKVLVTILGKDAVFDQDNETALLSEQALAKDWMRSEEDEAWKHLKQEV